MNIKEIEVTQIEVSNRKRPVSPERVADIQRSIVQQGLLQPIGVKPTENGFRLVFGAHRMAAFQEAGTPTITAMVFPAEMTDEECVLAEIQENLARNDLTGAERKAFAAEVGRICTNLNPVSNDDDLSKLDGKWLVDMGEKSGQSRSTMNNWWNAFCSETERSITPKQATPEDKSAFFDWLEEAKAKAEAEKVEKARIAEEERKRKELEAEAKRKESERKDLIKYLDDSLRMFDFKTVSEWLYQWMEGKES